MMDTNFFYDERNGNGTIEFVEFVKNYESGMFKAFQ